MNLRVRIVQDVFDISSEFRASSKGGSVATRGRREAHETSIHTRTASRRRGPAPIAPTARFGETRATSSDARLGRASVMSKAAFAGLKAVQELRFHLCQTSKGSEGVRNFLMSSYKHLKAASPTTPVLIREASGQEGKLYARYDFGVEKCVKLEGLDAKGVEKCLQDLVSAAPK